MEIVWLTALICVHYQFCSRLVILLAHEQILPYMQGNLLKIRRVYDAFLAEFPLCYGYWKKYAEHEAPGSVEKAVEVYERAVQAVTYSVDIWLHYCRFAIGNYEDPDIIRR